VGPWDRRTDRNIDYSGAVADAASRVEWSGTTRQRISGSQVRAARAFVGWTARALATKAAVRPFTGEWIEGEGKIAKKDLRDLAAIQATLEDGGIEFTNNDGVPGVRLHPSNKKQKLERPSRDRQPPNNATRGRGCLIGGMNKKDSSATYETWSSFGAPGSSARFFCG
jgi:hypothetical protein